MTTTDQPQRGGRREGAGRPRVGSRRQVVLDDDTVAVLTELGDGNLSAGIREAAQIIAQTPREPTR